jgi:hypothetical protein
VNGLWREQTPREFQETYMYDLNKTWDKIDGLYDEGQQTGGQLPDGQPYGPVNLSFPNNQNPFCDRLDQGPRGAGQAYTDAAGIVHKATFIHCICPTCQLRGGSDFWHVMKRISCLGVAYLTPGFQIYPNHGFNHAEKAAHHQGWIFTDRPYALQWRNDPCPPMEVDAFMYWMKYGERHPHVQQYTTVARYV